MSNNITDDSNNFTNFTNNKTDRLKLELYELDIKIKFAKFDSDIKVYKQNRKEILNELNLITKSNNKSKKVNNRTLKTNISDSRDIIQFLRLFEADCNKINYYVIQKYKNKKFDPYNSIKVSNFKAGVILKIPHLYPNIIKLFSVRGAFKLYLEKRLILDHYFRYVSILLDRTPDQYETKLLSKLPEIIQKIDTISKQSLRLNYTLTFYVLDIAYTYDLDTNYFCEISDDKLHPRYKSLGNLIDLSKFINLKITYHNKLIVSVDFNLTI